MEITPEIIELCSKLQPIEPKIRMRVVRRESETPTYTQIITFSNEGIHAGIWLDGERIDRDQLTNYIIIPTLEWIMGGLFGVLQSLQITAHGTTFELTGVLKNPFDYDDAHIGYYHGESIFHVCLKVLIALMEEEK